MIDTLLLTVIVAELALVLFWTWRTPDEAPARPEAAVAPYSAPESWDDLEALERDLHVEALIQAVAPEWKLGDDREHIALIPGADGHIERAELR